MKNYILVILITILFFGLMLFAGFCYSSYMYEKAKSDYYKSQMLEFCYMTEKINNVYSISSELYPCERWVVDK